MMLKNSLTIPGIIIALLTTMYSCSPRNNDDSRYETLPVEGWCYGDTIVYPLELADTLVRGELSVGLEHSPAYKYSNLWLEITYATIADSCETLVRDTLNIQLADSAGNWIGTGVASTYQLQSPPTTILLDARKPLTVRHIMRTDTLKGITRAGLFFQSSTNRND